jgi:predicted amidohydrolase
MSRAVGLVLAALVGASTAGLEPPEEAPRRLRVAGAQIPVTRDVGANLRALERAVRYAASEKAEVLLTPEGSLSGYSTDFDAEGTARALDRILAIARDARVGLALGTCYREPSDGRRYDELRFYTRDGEYLGFHAKILLCRRIADPASVGEIGAFGTRPLRTFRLADVTVGGLICNDLWANPEWTPQPDSHLSQQLADQGARVVFQAVNSGLARGEDLALNRHFHEANLRMRARAGRLWIVAADAASAEAGLSPQCPSGVVDPSGNWTVRVDAEGERFFAYTIELPPRPRP